MSAHQNNLKALKDKDSQKKRNIEAEGTSIDSSSKENHNDIPIGPNDSSVPQARQSDAPRKSERISKKPKEFASGGATRPATPKGQKIKSKLPLKARTAAPKAHATKLPAKTKATSKPKHNTKKRAAKLKTIAPDPETPIAIDEILPFQEERRHLYDAVEYFKDRLERIHVSLDKEADSPSRSISRDIMLMKAFEVEMENLVEYEFPMVVKASRRLAQAVMGPQKELGPEDDNEGDVHLEGKGGRKPVKKTPTQQMNKNRSRQDDDDGAEAQQQPRQQSCLPDPVPQDALGQRDMSTSTSGKRPREADPEDDNDHRQSKRSRRFWKGKGKTVTHASNNYQAPPQHIPNTEANASTSGSNTHQDTIAEADIDGDSEEIRSESTSSHFRSRQTSSTGSRHTPGCPPDRPTIHIIRPAP